MLFSGSLNAFRRIRRVKRRCFPKNAKSQKKNVSNLQDQYCYKFTVAYRVILRYPIQRYINYILIQITYLHLTHIYVRNLQISIHNVILTI